MNWTSRVVLRVGVFLLTVALCGCKGNSAERFKEFTQCIKGVDEALARKELLYVDTERECYGVRWKIPHALPSRKIVAYSPISESVWIYIDDEKRRELNDSGLQRLLPPVHTRILDVGPIFETPQDRTSRSMAVYESALKMKKSPERFGLNAKTSTLEDHFEDVLLYPSDDPTLFALCRPILRENGTQNIERAICDVRSAFADHLELHYTVPYAELARLRGANDEVIAWVRMFMSSGI
jgi:hypothetical protein